MSDLNFNASNVSPKLYGYSGETFMNTSNVSQPLYVLPWETSMNESNMSHGLNAFKGEDAFTVEAVMNASNVPHGISGVPIDYPVYSYNGDYSYIFFDYYSEIFGNATHNNTFDRSEMDKTFQDISYFTYAFLSLQVAIGVTGNAISFLVWMSGKECSTIACSMYFKLLAISDIFALTYCGLCNVIFEPLEQLALNVYWCIGLEFFSFFAPQMSTWLIALISVERVLSLTFPFSFNTRGARTRAKIAFVCLIMVLTAINSQSFMKDFTQDVFCIVNSHYVDVIDIMIEVSSVWMLCVIPFVIIIICNTIILTRFCLMKKTAAMGRQRSQRLVTFTRLSLASGLLQAVSMCPTMVKYLFCSYENLTYSQNMKIAMHYFSVNTLYLNNALQFMVCWLGSTQYRSDLKTFLCGKQKDARNQRTSQVTSE